MGSREAITAELLAGETPYHLSKRYPRATVYRIYNELVQSGQLQTGPEVVDTDVKPTFAPATVPTEAEPKPKAPSRTGAEVITVPGEKTLPADAVNRIRGILGITLRPKVLSCPMPELLYPAMVIAVTDLGFKPMRPDDFIDTVLYQWLEACDYIPYAYMKRSELEEYAKTYGVDIDKYAKERGLMTEQEFAEKYGITLPEEGVEEPTEPEEEIAEPAVEVLKEEIAEMQKEVEEEAKETGNEPRKPTVGDLLNRLHISNIQKEVEDDSSGRTEPDSPQSNNEPGE